MWLLLAFLVAAFVHAAAGLGGGSSYTALLSLAGWPPAPLKVLSRVCNLLVTAQGCWQFWRHGHWRGRWAWPFLVASVPLAFLGGMTPISAEGFRAVLAVGLGFSGLLLFFEKAPDSGPDRSHLASAAQRWLVGLALGGGVGYGAGLAAIGGGIFLAPVLHALRWGQPKEIASLASAFIFANSLAGLLGQAVQGDWAGPPSEGFWWLPGVVLVGGFLGSRCGASWFSQRLVKRWTGGLVFLVALRLGWEVLFG
ncbi:MAG: sulfite exporter TauE/SafE family protein [Verrucomicrobiota bacterium]